MTSESLRWESGNPLINSLIIGIVLEASTISKDVKLYLVRSNSCTLNALSKYVIQQLFHLFNLYKTIAKTQNQLKVLIFSLFNSFGCITMEKNVYTKIASKYLWSKPSVMSLNLKHYLPPNKAFNLLVFGNSCYSRILFRNYTKLFRSVVKVQRCNWNVAIARDPAI